MLALPRRDRSRCSRRARGRTRGSGGDPRGAGRAWAVHGWNPPGPRPWHRSFLPTASSCRSPRRARLGARGRRGGTGVCGWRPRCTACTRPAERHTVTEQPQTQSQTQGIPAHPSPCGLRVFCAPARLGQVSNTQRAPAHGFRT